MATPFDPKMISEFQNGIFARDLARVEKALDAGVNPATPVEGEHPLQHLLREPYHLSRGVEKEEFRQQGTAILELLLDRGVKLVENEKYATDNCRYLVDRLLMSERLADLSTVIIHAIGESLNEKGYVYQPEMGKFVASYLTAFRAPAGGDYKLHITDALNVLEMAHGIVGQRLENPQTDIEKHIVSKYSDKIDYWMHAFERPPLRLILEDLIPPSPAAPEYSADNRPAPKAAAESPEGMSQYVKVLPRRRPQEVLAEINGLIGMEDFKKDSAALMLRTQFDAARKIKGLKTTQQALHSSLVGNPGTGKTMSARLRAELLYSLDLAGPRYIEISRENAVGKYIGQTEANVLELFKQGDQIFFDEAYNLITDKEDKKDFGNRVVDALITALDKRRDTLVASFAGYPEAMDEFFSSNAGFKSRVPNPMTFKDYTVEQLGEILDLNLAKAEMKMAPEARDYTLTQLRDLKKSLGPRNFGNGRVVRTLVEQVPNRMSERLFSAAAAEMTSGILIAPADADLSLITKADVEALKLVEKQGAAAQPVKNEIGFLGNVRSLTPV